MPTKVFISWSGDLSKKLAEVIRDWLPSVLQFVRPYFTPNDIEKGARWASDISVELEKSDVGIVCLTKENMNNPWILFEMGALSKNLRASRVCPILFGIKDADIEVPIAMFQNTKFNRNDFKQLILTINEAEGETKLEERTVEKVFDKWWPELEENIDKILAGHNSSEIGNQRTERDILEEILQLSRLMAGVKYNSVYDNLTVLCGPSIKKKEALYNFLVHGLVKDGDAWRQLVSIAELFQSEN